MFEQFLFLLVAKSYIFFFSGDHGTLLRTDPSKIQSESQCTTESQPLYHRHQLIELTLVPTSSKLLAQKGVS